MFKKQAATVSDTVGRAQGEPQRPRRQGRGLLGRGARNSPKLVDGGAGAPPTCRRIPRPASQDLLIHVSLVSQGSSILII